jgi:hypothetical protein
MTLDYAEIAVTWIIRLVIAYFILSLLEGLMNWKGWVLIGIGVLIVFVIIDKILEIRAKKLVV